MQPKTCGNCKNHETELEDRQLVKCNADITVYGWKDKSSAATGCPFWTAKHPDRHLLMTKIIATSYSGWKDPFDIRIFCTDGNVYRGSPQRIKQARCAGWSSAWRRYSEFGSLYEENVLQGGGLPVVVTDELLL